MIELVDHLQDAGRSLDVAAAHAADAYDRELVQVEHQVDAAQVACPLKRPVTSQARSFRKLRAVNGKANTLIAGRGNRCPNM